MDGHDYEYLPPSIPEEIYATITRYRSYGWEWRIITTTINRKFGISYTVAQLRQLYQAQK